MSQAMPPIRLGFVRRGPGGPAFAMFRESATTREGAPLLRLLQGRGSSRLRMAIRLSFGTGHWFSFTRPGSS